jgi:uncharacterized protein HemY
MNKHAKEAAEAILIDLNDRGGFDSWWEDIDRATKAEIKAAIAGHVQEALDAAVGGGE